MNKNLVVSILGISIVVLGAALAIPAHAQAPIRIGASLSLTGTYSRLGQNQQRGYQLCAKEANENGGVLGRKRNNFV